MATANQILSLLKSHVEGDDEQLYSIALQIAAAEARRGRESIAKELKSIVEEARSRHRKKNKSGRLLPFVEPRGELTGLVHVSHPKTILNDMVLSPSIRQRLETLLLEQRQRDRLRSYGKRPSSRLLMVGPPGSGKTMTAAALSGELRLPLMTIRLEALITRFLGETAAKMRLIFDEIARQRAVYLFDEFDALGGRRGLENEVGEMRRVLNSFLQFVEEPTGTDSLIIATTNHPQLLDYALLRRFDDVIEYGLPNELEIREVLKANLKPLKISKINWKKVTQAAQGLSQGEIASAAEEVVKHAILQDEWHAKSEGILRSLDNRRMMRGMVIRS